MEWWQADKPAYEVQVITVANTVQQSETTGTFVLNFNGVSSAAMKPDISAFNMRRVLMRLFSTAALLPTLSVTRQVYGNLGYHWYVTFTTQATGVAGFTTAAYGDVPRLVPISTLGSSGSGTSTVTNDAITATGSRPNGVAEVQRIVLTRTSIGVASTGYFKLSYGGYTTPLLSVAISASELAAALTVGSGDRCVMVLCCASSLVRTALVVVVPSSC